MEEKNGLIDKNTGDCIGFGAVVGHITREVVGGFIDNGVED